MAMAEYTSYGYEFVPDMGEAGRELVIVPPSGHKGPIELTEEDLLYMLSVLRSE